MKVDKLVYKDGSEVKHVEVEHFVDNFMSIVFEDDRSFIVNSDTIDYMIPAKKYYDKSIGNIVECFDYEEPPKGWENYV